MDVLFTSCWINELYVSGLSQWFRSFGSEAERLVHSPETATSAGLLSVTSWVIAEKLGQGPPLETTQPQWANSTTGRPPPWNQTGNLLTPRSASCTFPSLVKLPAVVLWRCKDVRCASDPDDETVIKVTQMPAPFSNYSTRSCIIPLKLPSLWILNVEA